MSKRAQQQVDIHTVAKRAQVSIATVSRVINGSQTVNRSLAARVNKAVAELGYRPNTHARTLVSGRSHIVGLIITLITNPFYPELIQSFETLAAQRGYDLLIASTSDQPDRKLDCLRRMDERKVDGVAMMTFGADEELLRALAERGLPVVSIGSSDIRGVQPVHVDFGCGIREAVQYLAVLGHRRMAFISGPLRVDNSNARRQAFLDGMRQIGVRVPASYLPEGDHTMESGFKGAEKLLSLPDRPTAILCSNDMTAIGALHAASDRQLRVPQDVSIVGFDDIHMAQFTVPPLTTVRISSERIASTALDLLIGSIEHRKAVEQPVIPTQLVVRATTGYAPAPKDRRKSRPRSGR